LRLTLAEAEGLPEGIPYAILTEQGQQIRIRWATRCRLPLAV
jgi:hypothetical protein